MYIQRNKKSRTAGGEYESALLCHKYREGGKIKTQVLANLSMLPQEALLSLENSLKSQKSGKSTLFDTDISVEKVIDFGYFFILYSLVQKLRISQLFDTLLPEQSAIIQLVIIGKIITKGSKLAIFNWIKRNPFFAELLGLDSDSLKLETIYQTIASLPMYQEKIERKWGLYHKASEKEIFLYDITSSYLEGVTNQLAAFGYNRDGKKGKMQITIGLITDKDGFPLKIEVFEGNQNDHTTVQAQLKALKETFGAERIIFVGDRGMKIRYNLEQMNQIESQGIEYITGLTKDEIKSLLKKEVLQLNLFSTDLVEIQDGEVRYILSVNLELAKQKKLFRNKQREKFEDAIQSIQTQWQKRNNQYAENRQKIENGHKNKKLAIQFKPELLQSYRTRIILLLDKYKMNAYYSYSITEEECKIDFDLAQYNKDKNMDGLYVLQTNVKPEILNKTQVREQYKRLQHVEHAFRDMKSVQLQIRPIYHVNESTTRGHVLLTMFSYAVIQKLEQAVFPMLKDLNKQLSYNDIKDELAQIKIVELNLGKDIQKIQITKLTEIQKKVFDALKIPHDELTKFENVATKRKK